MEDAIISLEFHKGNPCVFKPMLCQEGWCCTCVLPDTINKKSHDHRYSSSVTGEKKFKHNFGWSKKQSLEKVVLGSIVK